MSGLRLLKPHIRGMLMHKDIVVYRWTEVLGIRKRDVLRLHEIRLYIASIRAGKPQFNSMVPVLMDDGRNPYIVLSSGPVHILSKSNRYGKMVAGNLLPCEQEYAQPVPGLFTGDPASHPVYSSLYNELERLSADIPLSPFNYPMWCRKARTRQSLCPRNNQLMVEELKIGSVPKHQQARALKDAWDRLADNAYCTGYCNDGFLFDADMIRSGGVVCVPRQYGSPLDITGACLRSDMMHIVKTHNWRGVKL